MANDSNENLAGPLEIDLAAIERDAMIRENNDGKPIDDAAVREYVAQNKNKIFGMQTAFFSELRRKLDQN
jgi:hypothetical protein